MRWYCIKSVWSAKKISSLSLVIILKAKKTSSTGISQVVYNSGVGKGCARLLDCKVYSVKHGTLGVFFTYFKYEGYAHKIPTHDVALAHVFSLCMHAHVTINEIGIESHFICFHLQGEAEYV